MRRSISEWEREAALADARSRERREAAPPRRRGVPLLHALAMTGEVVGLLLLGFSVLAALVVLAR